jgi:hypothetical protein
MLDRLKGLFGEAGEYQTGRALPGCVTEGAALKIPKGTKPTDRGTCYRCGYKDIGQAYWDAWLTRITRLGELAS